MESNLKEILYPLVGRWSARRGRELKAPVFIVGTGRCGTSLSVKILNSHPQLAGYPSEGNRLWHPRAYPYHARTVDTPPIVEDPLRFIQISLSAWPRGHEETIRRTFLGFLCLKGSSRTFFLKSAMISHMMPKIITIFPDARFLHVYRTGPSVVESFLKKEWDKYRNYFRPEEEFRLLSAGYWNDCILEIEKQKQLLRLEERGRFFEYSYEGLCADPSGTMSRLASFLGIDAREFGFDLGKVSSTNFKVGDFSGDPRWITSLERMAPAMKLKGYL